MTAKEQGLPALPPGLEGWLTTHQRVLLRELIESEVAKRAALSSNAGERGVVVGDAEESDEHDVRRDHYEVADDHKWPRHDGFFIKKADMAPMRRHNGRGGDADSPLPPFNREHAALRAQPAVQGGGQWIPASVAPDVEKGSDSDFWVTVRRKSGKLYAFPATYANALPLLSEDARDNSGPGWSQRALSEGESDEADIEITGWYDHKSDTSGDYDTVYEPVCQHGDELVAWMHAPAPCGDARAQPAGGGDIPQWALPAVESALAMLDEQGYAHTDLAAFRDWLKEKSA